MRIHLAAGRGRYLALGTLVLVNFLWAVQYPAYKIASERMSAAALNLWTLGFAALLLLPFLARERMRRTAPRDTGGPRNTLLEFTLLGVFGMVPPSVLLAWGISHSTASNASILSLTIPVLMTAMAVVLLGEKVTSLRILSLVLALGGTLFVSRSDLTGDLLDTSLLMGNAAIFAAGLGSAFYNTYGKRLLLRFSELEVLVYSYLVCCLACIVISLLWDREPFYRVSGYPLSVWVAVGALGVFTWGIAMVLWMWVLKRLEASQVSVSIYLLSIFGVLLSAFTLHERISLPQILGGLLVLLATFLTSR